MTLRKNRFAKLEAPPSRAEPAVSRADAAQALNSDEDDASQSAAARNQGMDEQVQPAGAAPDAPTASESNGDEIDFTNDNPKSSEAAPALAPYDSRPAEDGARRTIAFMLIGILFVIIGAVLIMVAFGSIQVSDLKEFAVILGPVITLVSAATGFYYGTKSK